MVIHIYHFSSFFSFLFFVVSVLLIAACPLTGNRWQDQYIMFVLAPLHWLPVELGTIVGSCYCLLKVFMCWLYYTCFNVCTNILQPEHCGQQHQMLKTCEIQRGTVFKCHTCSDSLHHISVHRPLKHFELNILLLFYLLFILCLTLLGF